MLDNSLIRIRFDRIMQMKIRGQHGANDSNLLVDGSQMVDISRGRLAAALQPVAQRFAAVQQPSVCLRPSACCWAKTMVEHIEPGSGLCCLIVHGASVPEFGLEARFVEDAARRSRNSARLACRSSFPLFERGRASTATVAAGIWKGAR